MRRHTMLAVLVSLLALATVPPGAAQEKPRAERPVYAIGDRWALTDGVYELTRIEKGVYVFSAGAGREIRLSPDLAIVRVQKGPEVVEFFPPPKLTWPLEVGKWGRVRVTMYTAEFPRGTPVSITWKVDAYEDVDLGGQRVKAFRIVSTLIPEPEDSGSLVYREMAARPRYLVTAYAPELRRLVVAESRDLPLLAFRATADALAVAAQPTPAAPTVSPAAKPAAPPPPAQPAPAQPPATPAPRPSPPAVAAPPAATAPTGAPPSSPAPPASTSGAAAAPPQLTLSSPVDQTRGQQVGSSRVDLQACKLEYSIVSPK